MDAIAENEERVFEHYLELPENARTEVIGQMEPDDRCRFRRCCKLSKKEAEASKNYVHAMRIYYQEGYVEYEVELIKDAFPKRGFCLSFAEQFGKKYKEYRNLDNAKLWDVELDSSTDLIQCAIEDLKYRLKTYQGSMEVLIITGDASMLTSVDLRFKNLGILETLQLCDTVDISQALSKLQEPLEELYVRGTDNISLSSNHEQLYQVQNKICWWNANFDIEQLQRLAAKNVETGIGQLTEKDVFKFIRSWQDGTTGKDIEHYEWSLSKSSFRKKKLLRLLRIQNREGRKFEIKHYKEVGKRAFLIVNRSTLHFGTDVSGFDIFDSDSSGSDSDF